MSETFGRWLGPTGAKMNAEVTPSDGSVWIQQIRGGQAQGIDEAWSRFFPRLMSFVTHRTRGIPESVVNAEDIAASVFESAWRASQEGRLVSVRDRDELWWWLLRIAQFKTTDHVRRAMKQSAGGDVLHVSDDEQVLTLLSREPDAAFCAILKEEFTRVLTLLGDEKMQKIAIMKIEGYSNREIELKLNIAPATVTRKLNIIRETWAKEMDDEESSRR